MSGETSAEMTAGIDGQTGTAPTGESDTAGAADAPSPSASAAHINGQPTIEETPDVSAPPNAEAASEAALPEAPAAEAPAAEAPAVTPDAERPAVGPKILGVAADPKPLPTVKAALPTRKRRRRPSAAERHRRAFFSALTDLRRGGNAGTQQATAPDGEQATTAVDADTTTGEA
ncbi:MAG TPA: hypothetical protein VGR11_01080, partial [Solirubrobacteraceae bacterium]|nr:hypothetical protein [Solirubrobacteraceae bacterium]